MGRLIYTAITSLDGYVNDATGGFQWAAPDSDVHAFVNELERPIGTYLYGRSLYETMVYWETVPTGPEESDVANAYAELWRAADKVVYSRTLVKTSSARTRIVRTFDSHEVRALVEDAATDVSIGGPGLAASAFRAGIVDEVGLFLTPVTVGGGTPAHPSGLFQRLRLVDQTRFDSGVVYLRYDVVRS